MTVKELEHALIDAGFDYEQGIISGYWKHKKFPHVFFTDWQVERESDAVAKQLSGMQLEKECDYSQ